MAEAKSTQEKVENRDPRDLETREMGERKKTWQRPEVLPTPNARAGYTPHWVRVSTNGVVDATNVSSKLREGWVPAKAADHPEITIVAIEHSRFKDNVVIGGLMLCWAPNEMVDERNSYFAQQANQQIQSVDNNLMRENDARMPLFNERKTKVTFGSGN